MNDTPANFDWVDARGKCSAIVMFETLRRLADANTKQRNAQLRSEQFHFGESEDIDVRTAEFTILDTRTGYRVKFALSGQTIHASTLNDTEILRATLTLTDSGECKFKIGTDVLHPWQVLRRALEPLFFGK